MPFPGALRAVLTFPGSGATVFTVGSAPSNRNAFAMVPLPKSNVGATTEVRAAAHISNIQVVLISQTLLCRSAFVK